MDETFVTGVGAVASAILVFCGSIWLLLSFVLGPRLAYFITASVTLGFVLIMGLVWSQVQLGPVGQLPEWNPVAIGEDASEVDFDGADEYPEAPWQAVDEDNQAESTKASELESDATKYLEDAINEGDVTLVPVVAQARVKEDSTRLLERGGTEYGALLLEPVPLTPEEEEAGVELPEGEVLVVMSYDPGNPLGKARAITAGVFVLFVAHLFGLSRVEKRSRSRPETA
jgi:hypothetical protein